MKKLIVAAALLVCACSPATNTTTTTTTSTATASTAEPVLTPVTLPISDHAGNRMEALTQNGDRWCTSDGAWCVVGAEDTQHSVLHDARTVVLPGAGAAWPSIIRIGEDGALVGVVNTDEQMYSGGGGSASHVTFYDVSGAAPREVATLPLGGAVDTRACFSEEDQHNRADACSDQYTFVTRVGLDESVSRGAPRITLETSAGTFPGHVSRGADSTEAPPLQAADLVWWHDDTCSYHRVFNRGANGLYTPDRPLPACSDYLEP